MEVEVSKARGCRDPFNERMEWLMLAVEEIGGWRDRIEVTDGRHGSFLGLGFPSNATRDGSRSLHNGPDTVEELFDRHIVKKDKSLDDEEEELLARRRLTSTRREVLSLYRDIFRASRFFTWPDSRGVLWRDVLRENARREFKDARFEKDPEIVTRLLIGGRDAVESALEKLAEKQRQQIEKERSGGDGRALLRWSLD